MFSYQIEWDEERYYHVLYQRFDKPSGILMIDSKGQAIPKDLAKQVVAPINYYNNIAKGAAADLVREKDRDVRPMLDLHRILQEQATFFSESLVAEDVERVVEMLDLILDGQQSLRDIFEELKQIDIEARDKRGYITKEDVDRFMTLNKQYQSILYRQGKVQQETYVFMDNLVQFIKQNENSIQETHRLIDVLSSFQNPKVKRTLDDSLQSFEKDAYGKRHSFAVGQAGVEQMLALYEEKTRFEVEHELFKLLRNQ